MCVQPFYTVRYEPRRRHCFTFCPHPRSSLRPASDVYGFDFYQIYPALRRITHARLLIEARDPVLLRQA